MGKYEVEFSGLTFAAIAYLIAAIAMVRWEGIAFAVLVLFLDISIKPKAKP